ncbi:3-oxoacyl-[acyl-carrier protein] reductase [Chitinophaga sp. YR573]|uniref:SDR family oxidoreductase n=1 Tax=Chitinophaga sp. YR573 TaxID=1881040 RepID=UPI0008CF5382|nr:SDR family oxidoreductase [Chitinophaga sp. YR573]SEW46798.1 3-oxoacyl-[acyl-carrier protein] reductase [Chitinophaga sp. YR573]
MSTLNGKVALVTGGSRGIGAAIVKKLAQEGANVAFTYISSADKANALVTEVEKNGTKALAIKADNADPKAITDAVNKTVSTFGKLDILVNNAAVFIAGTLDQADDMADQYNRQSDINIRAIPAAIRAASKVISDGGRIIIIGSVVASAVGFPTLTEYGATKAAAGAYGRGYAWDLGHRNITVNTVQPGPINTDMNPDEGEFADLLKAKTALKRYGTAEEVAGVVSFLAGPDAGYITGASINVDGGILA